MPLGTKLFSVSLAALAALATTAGTARATTVVANAADVTKTNAASDWASKSTSFGSFGAGYAASWTFYSKTDGTSMYEKAEASASGQLFGAKFSMVDLWAQASSGTSSTVAGAYELDILGKQILSGSPSLSGALNNLSLEKGYAIVKVGQTIEVGVPITLTLESDLTAALGLTATSSYSGGASSLSFTGTPSVGVGLTASVGIGVSFASAGVEALGGSWNDSVTSFRVLWDDTVSASSVTVSISGATATESYHYGDSGNVNEAGSSYAWQRADDASGTNATTIRTTSGSWSLSAGDNQKYLRFCVTPSNGVNTGAQTCSAWEAVGHLVELYKDGGYGGSSVHLAYERSSAQTCFNLGDYGFNDVVSSFHFEGVSGWASTVEMFYDGSCSGNTAYYTSSTGGGSYSLSSLNSYWNDQISSLKVYY